MANKGPAYGLTAEVRSKVSGLLLSVHGGEEVCVKCVFFMCLFYA